MMTKKFIGQDGRLSSVEVSNVEWIREDGRFIPVPVAGSEEIIPADLVLLAMGFLGPESPALTALQVEQDARSNIKADLKCFRTNVEKVFAAGDARRGQSLVVWAINEGRAAARACDCFMMGCTSLP
jgi:glutamate synthase (NADPH/NADH) small chain